MTKIEFNQTALNQEEKQTLLLIILLLLDTIAIICVFGMIVFLNKLGTVFYITLEVFSVTEVSL
ncbi:hypothetical protein DVH24_020787 [Malus domestica]|uniref:Uncharacterized protein n=1 Tax=Malus domestica TaxID=3750 RepID=A0A498JCC6_MALDO|nr:hypothetical protein DVH24_020787 [Malus domestica]